MLRTHEPSQASGTGGGGSPAAVTTKACPPVGHVMTHDAHPGATLCAPSPLTVVAVCDVATTQPRLTQSAACVLAVQVFSAHARAGGVASLHPVFQ